jgi:hypothetical protein
MLVPGQEVDPPSVLVRSIGRDQSSRC